MDYKIRTILKGEDSLLQDFLYQAIFVPEGVPSPPKSIINQPELQVYIADFGKKKDDIGQIVFKVLIKEAVPAIVSGFTILIVSLLGSTAMAGMVGAGGLGAVALIYGYQSFNQTIMYGTVIILIILVQCIQTYGSHLYRKLK